MFILALRLAIDSFVACLAIGLQRLSWHERLALAASFGLCDGMASSLGSLHLHAIPGMFPFTAYIFCAYVLGRAAAMSRPLLYLLPTILSIDNLLSADSTGTSPIIGLTSAAVALLGLSLGGALRYAFYELEVAA
jgi:putative Mn2+ efflux pump MntP